MVFGGEGLGLKFIKAWDVDLWGAAGFRVGLQSLKVRCLLQRVLLTNQGLKSRVLKL